MSGEMEHLAGERILLFSTADWDTLLPTNKHHIARQLARRNEVLFVETLGTRAPQLAGGRDLARVGRRLKRAVAGAVEREPNLRTISPLVRPRWRSRADIALNRVLFDASAGRACRPLMSEIVWVYSPYAIHLLRNAKPKLLVYHLVDDLAAVPGADRDALREAEALLFARADVAFCSEEGLFERAKAARLGGATNLSPNVADFDHFASAQPRIGGSSKVFERLQALEHPRLVFSGHLASHKVDLELLRAIAARRRDWQFVLIGPRWEADPNAPLCDALLAEPNVLAVGHVPYEDLPPLLHEADVLLVPYALTNATRAVFPLKLFEYFATGRPVVASGEVPSLAQFSEVAHLARNDAAEWELAIEVALAEPSERASTRIALARGNTWTERFAQMEAAMIAAMRAKGMR